MSLSDYMPFGSEFRRQCRWLAGVIELAVWLFKSITYRSICTTQRLGKKNEQPKLLLKTIVYSLAIDEKVNIKKQRPESEHISTLAYLYV